MKYVLSLSIPIHPVPQNIALTCEMMRKTAYSYNIWPVGFGDQQWLPLNQSDIKFVSF